MEYIKKTIETESGCNAEFWIVTGIWIDLKANCAIINLDGYKDLEAFTNKKISIGKKEIAINGLELLPIYFSVHDVVINSILNHDTFKEGSIEHAEEK